jgi:hypothetical protein
MDIAVIRSTFNKEMHEMPAFMKLIATSLAASILGMSLAAVPALADTTTTPSTAAPTTATSLPTDRQVNVAIDALRDVLNAMVDNGALRPEQRDAVVDAARRADWDGYSIERLGDILGELVSNNVISARQRDMILDGVRHARNTVFRLAAALEILTPRVLSTAQRDAIVDALHRADWDGFSVERLGDILGGLVSKNVITARQRAAILDLVRR